MSEPVTPMVVILLCSALGLLVVVLALLLGMARRLTCIERRLADALSREEAARATTALAEIPHGGAFETFLNEEPARRSLTKSEQFAAYRRWRQENGLNWSNP